MTHNQQGHSTLPPHEASYSTSHVRTQILIIGSAENARTPATK